MRRFDRYSSLPQSDDERRVAFPREANWVRSSLDQFATTQHKLRATIAQNYDNIMVARQENVVIAENVRATATVYNQLSDRLSRMENLFELEKESLDSVVKSTKQAEASLVGQQRQMANRGLQMERGVAKLEEEVMRLKQVSELNSKKCQTINDKISEILQQLSNQSHTMNAGIQDLRQLNHDAEMNAKKNARSSIHEIEQRIEAEEQKRRKEHSLAMEKIQALQTIVNDVRQHEKSGLRSYTRLVEEKDQEYRNELNNLFRKISAHINEKHLATNSKDKKLIHDLSGKVRFLEGQLAMEKAARVESLEKLEDETTRHFRKVSKDIIAELDKLSSSMQNTHSKDHIEIVIKEMKKEIQANKQMINRVLRAEITARKSQAQKFSSSIQGVQKHSSQTVAVVQEAIHEIKSYVDRELGMKSTSPDENANTVIPTLEKRLSDVEEKLIQQQYSDKKSEMSMKSPSSPEYETDVARRLSELEFKFARQLAMLGHEKLHKRNSDAMESSSSKRNRTKNVKNNSNPSKDHLLLIENNIATLSNNLNKVEYSMSKFKRTTTHEMLREKKIRNKFVEFVNSRLLKGERLKIFIKSFGVYHMKYLTNDNINNKYILNIWGVYQASRMYEFKKKWLKLINKEPVNIDLKEYRKILKEEKETQRLEAKKAEKKRKMSNFVIDSYSDSSEESEKEPEPKPNPEAEKEPEKILAEEEEEPEEKKEEVPPPVEEGPKRINYEDHAPDNDYIKYKTDEEDEDDDDETEEFFPVTSSEEDFQLFSDEDDDDTDDTEEEEEASEKSGNNSEDREDNESEKEEDTEENKEEDSEDDKEDDSEEDEEKNSEEDEEKDQDNTEEDRNKATENNDTDRGTDKNNGKQQPQDR